MRAKSRLSPPSGGDDDKSYSNTVVWVRKFYAIRRGIAAGQKRKKKGCRRGSVVDVYLILYWYYIVVNDFEVVQAHTRAPFSKPLFRQMKASTSLGRKIRLDVWASIRSKGLSFRRSLNYLLRTRQLERRAINELNILIRVLTLLNYELFFYLESTFDLITYYLNLIDGLALSLLL